MQQQYFHQKIFTEHADDLETINGDRMMRQSKKWIKLFENEDEEFWQTPTKKNGKRSFVVRSRGIDTYYTEQEFTDHIFAVNRVNDELYKPNGNCYL